MKYTIHRMANMELNVHLAFFILLVAAAGKISAATMSPESERQTQELLLKLEAFEQKLVTIQANQEELQRNRQLDLNTVNILRQELEEEKQARSNLEEERQKQNKRVQDLQHKFQAKVESNSKEFRSLKDQLIKFFSTVSPISGRTSGNEKSVGNSSTAGDEEGKGKSASSISDQRIVDNEEATFISTTLEVNTQIGVNYIRWGRTTCERDADRLYSGFAVGKYRQQAESVSGGSDLICLHDEPDFSSVVSSYRGPSPITGVEYEFFHDDPFSKENVDGNPLTSHNMPCAVCHVETRSQQLMIPGKKDCPSGWIREYWGYLVSTHQYVHGGSYTCLDQAPEGAIGGSGNTGFVQEVHTVEVNIAALPNPPFFNGYEVVCVVCSK